MAQAGAPSLSDRAVPGHLPETTGRAAYITACLQATTLGELATIVERAKTSGEFDARDLEWARELWWGLEGCDALAWALLRRELGAVEA